MNIDEEFWYKNMDIFWQYFEERNLKKSSKSQKSPFQISGSI